MAALPPVASLWQGIVVRPQRHLVAIGAASSPYGGEIDDCSDIFDVHHWADSEPVTLGALTIVPRLVAHPTESFGLRITDPSGASLAYSGDTGICDQLVELARGVDVFLCRPPGHTRPNIHPIYTCRAPKPVWLPRKPAFVSCC